MSPHPKTKKGQKWAKPLSNGTSFYAAITGRGKGDRFKAVCSDGNTHSLNPLTLYKKYELVVE